jgi:type II secretory pathway pseudopilin PulG
MRRDEHGFTYLGLLFAIALSAGGLGVAASLWSTEAKREREAQLLFVGDQIRAAIGAYYEKAPDPASHAFPPSLDDLLEDKRWPVRRRHLRKVFLDPMNNRPEWGIVTAPNGGVIGVFSLSEAVPLKQGRFAPQNEDFAGATSYRDWRFVYVPSEAPGSTTKVRPPGS